MQTWTMLDIFGPRVLDDVLDDLTRDRVILSPQTRNSIVYHSPLQDTKEFRYQLELRRTTLSALGIRSPVRFNEVCMRGVEFGFTFPQADTVVYVAEDILSGKITLTERDGTLIFPYRHIFSPEKVSGFSVRKDERGYVLITNTDGRKSFSPNFSRFSFIFTK